MIEYILAVDKGNVKFKDMSVATLTAKQDDNFKVLFCGVGNSSIIALDDLYEKSLNTIPNLYNMIEKAKVENNSSEFYITMKEDNMENNTEKPKCFDLCTDRYCDMPGDHCSNRDFPPMSRCCRCEFWFTNMERKQDDGRVKVKDVTELSIFNDGLRQTLISKALGGLRCPPSTITGFKGEDKPPTVFVIDSLAVMQTPDPAIKKLSGNRQQRRGRKGNENNYRRSNRFG